MKVVKYRHDRDVLHKYWEHSVQGHSRMLHVDFVIKDDITWENDVSKLCINAAV